MCRLSDVFNDDQGRWYHYDDKQVSCLDEARKDTSETVTSVSFCKVTYVARCRTPRLVPGYRAVTVRLAVGFQYLKACLVLEVLCNVCFNTKHVIAGHLFQ